MSTIFMLLGIQGSGKSTYANKVLKVKYPDAIFIASDKVRDANPTMTEDKIWPEIYRLIKEALDKGKDVIYDATNITPWSRKNFFLKLKDYEFKKECYYIKTNPDICLSRVLKRNKNPEERYLPPQVVYMYAKSIIDPTYEEGFDKIHIIENFSI